jgi:hypothetical protein
MGDGFNSRIDFADGYNPQPKEMLAFIGNPTVRFHATSSVANDN